MRAILEKKEHLSSTIQSFTFKTEKTLEYTAGQFVEITLQHSPADSRSVQRWFTLTSSPTEPLLSIATRFTDKPSSFKQALQELQTGQAVEISQAMGDFVLPMQKNVPLLFITAGIGVTPLRSILAHLRDTNEKRDIHVMYTTRDKEDQIFTELISDISTEATFIVDHTQSVRNVLPKIVKYYQDRPHLRIYISGPESFTEETVSLLRNQSIPQTRLITDFFHGYDV